MIMKIHISCNESSYIMCYWCVFTLRKQIVETMPTVVNQGEMALKSNPKLMDQTPRLVVPSTGQMEQHIESRRGLCVSEYISKLSARHLSATAANTLPDGTNQRTDYTGRLERAISKSHPILQKPNLGKRIFENLSAVCSPLHVSFAQCSKALLMISSGIITHYM